MLQGMARRPTPRRRGTAHGTAERAGASEKALRGKSARGAGRIRKGAPERGAELRPATTDGARDTDEVHVPALDEGDGAVTERLHEPEACTNRRLAVNQGIPDIETVTLRTGYPTVRTVTFTGRPQFGPVVDLAYTRERASW